MFNLEKSNYKELSKVHFNSDDIFNDRIKEPFQNSNFFYIIVGKPGSGKTSLLINMLNNRNIYKNVFDKINLVMPKSTQQNIRNNIFDDLPEDQIFYDIDESILDKIKSIKADFEEEKEMRKKKKLKERKFNQLLILDDVTAYLKDKENLRMLTDISTNRRQYNLSVILLVQFLRAVPRPIRFFTTTLYFFKPSNNLDMSILKEEYITIDADQFVKLANFVFNNQHDFLIINKNNETYYKNLQKIIMPKTE